MEVLTGREAAWNEEHDMELLGLGWTSSEDEAGSEDADADGG